MNTVAIMDAARVYREADERLHEAIAASTAARAAESKALDAWSKASEQLHAAASGGQESPAAVVVGLAEDVEEIVAEMGRSGMVVR